MPRDRLARERTGVTTKNLLERMLHPAVKLGTSTPRADPSGDYAWEIFKRSDRVQPGSYEMLSPFPLGDNVAMIRIDIRPVWRIRSSGAEREFDFQLVTMLERIDATLKQDLS